jgi:cardiolipin synthase C
MRCVISLFFTSLVLLQGALTSSEAAFDPYSFASTAPHQLRLIERAGAGVGERLEMIRGARRSIDIEYFYFEPDRAGRPVLQALVEKKRAQPSVLIRILLDCWGSRGFTPALAAALASEGIEVRYFNDAPLVLVGTYNHRDHRKLFITDRSKMIIGGANISDEHLGLSEEFNFVDREILIRGEAVSAAPVSKARGDGGRHETPQSLDGRSRDRPGGPSFFGIRPRPGT